MVQFFLYGLTELVEKGKMEKKVYDFPRYYEVIRNLQPQACISVCDEDFGSRKALENEKDLIWYPAEVNTSIRPGWFYHPEEDNGVRPLSELIDIYYKSVGGNATFLLNIPPSPLGLYHLSFGEAEIRHVVLQEDISKSQRVESFFSWKLIKMGSGKVFIMEK